MYAQLGSIVFDGLFGPSSFSVEGDEAAFAEHELIGGKPRLQKTGDSLQELNFEIKLHAKFCNPQDQLNTLKRSKDEGEILSLLLGNGQYMGDYVIISFPYKVDETTGDGTIIQATVNLTLKEYVSYNRLEQKQLNARKQAFAVGNKKPVVRRPPQGISIDTKVSSHASLAVMEATKVDSLISEHKNNPSGRNILGIKINEACSKAENAISDMNNTIDDIQSEQDKYSEMKASGTNMINAINAVKANNPFTDLDNLSNSNTYLQRIVREFKKASTPLSAQVITRKV